MTSTDRRPGSGVTALVRLAWRQVRHDRLRTLFVVGLIAVPVAAAIVVGGAVRVSRGDPLTTAEARMGQADLRVVALSDDSRAMVEQVLDDAVQDGTVGDLAEVEHAWLPVTAAGPAADIVALDLEVPLTAGMVVADHGALPGRGEVGVSPSFAVAADVGVGDEVVLAPGTDPVIVSGLVSRPDRLGDSLVVVGPADLNRILPPVDDREPGGTDYLIATRAPGITADRVLASIDTTAEEPVAVQDGWVEPLVADGQVNVITRQDLLMEPPRSLTEHPATMSTLVGAGLLAEVALIAGAAWAAGIRRRLREIGLLSAQGASTSQVRRLVVGEALVTGVLGAVVGAAIALLGLVLGAGLLERVVERPVVGLPLDVPTVLAPAVAGVVAAVVAAWLPARTAAGVPTLVALQGRMPVRSPARWVVPAGIALGAIGFGLVAVSRESTAEAAPWQGGAGMVALIAGTAMLAGPLVALLGRIADRLPATARLVVRDAARQRTRAAAAVAASMIVLTAPVAAAAAIDQDQAAKVLDGLPADQASFVVQAWSTDDALPPGGIASLEDGDVLGEVDVPPALLDDVRAELPDARVASFLQYDGWAGPVLSEGMVAMNTSFDDVPTGAVAEAEWVSIRDVQIAARTPALLATLGLPGDLPAGPVLLGTTDRTRPVAVESTTVEAREVVAAVSPEMPRLLVDPATADDLGLVPRARWAVVALDAPVTRHQLDRVGAVLRDTDDTVDAYPEWIVPGGLTPHQGLAIGLGVAVLVMLLVVGMVTALTAAESRRDLRLLTAVGAAPSIRRRFLGAQTALHVVLGALLAAPLGWLFAQMLMGQRTLPPEVSLFGRFDAAWVAVPWPLVALVVLVLPVVLGGVTAAVVRSSPTRPPRRPT